MESAVCNRIPTEETQAAAPSLTEGLLAHAHFNHDPLHRSSQDKKEGQESVDAESLLPGHSLKSSPHLGPEEHDRGLQVGYGQNGVPGGSTNTPACQRCPWTIQ